MLTEISLWLGVKSCLWTPYYIYLRLDYYKSLTIMLTSCLKTEIGRLVRRVELKAILKEPEMMVCTI